MASNIIKLRHANSMDFSDPDIGKILRSLRNDNYDPWIWEFLLAPGMIADGAAAEVRVDFTTEFNGEAIPIILYVKGEAANEDKAAGTGARRVTIYGINTFGNPDFQHIDMHATAGTQVASTTLWKRFIGAQVTIAGSGGVNAGIIQISNDGQTEVYGTIAAGENATIGARVYIPTDYNAFLHMKGGIVNVYHATDVNGEVGDGIIIEPVYLSSPTRLSTDIYWIPVTDMAIKDLGIYREIIEGADTYYITFKHSTKAGDSNQTPIYHIRIIMYGTTNTLRGLGA